MLWQGGGFLPGHLGIGVWWRLGPEAQVVCRQLECGLATSTPLGSHFGLAFGKVQLDNVRCTGAESRLALCAHDSWFSRNCGPRRTRGSCAPVRGLSAFWVALEQWPPSERLTASLATLTGSLTASPSPPGKTHFYVPFYASHCLCRAVPLCIKPDSLSNHRWDFWLCSSACPRTQVMQLDTT
jgi:hypothetical protein